MTQTLVTQQKQRLPLLKQAPQQLTLAVAQARAASPTTSHRPIIDIYPDAGLDLHLLRNGYPNLSTLVNYDLEEWKTLDKKISTHLEKLYCKRSETLSEEQRQDLQNL